jgi:subtilisin family serine protease
MRDWHHKIIKLDDALTSLSGNNNKVVIGVFESQIEFENLSTPLNGLNYKAKNKGLFKVTNNLQKSSTIGQISGKVSPNIPTNNSSAHTTSVAGVVLGNKSDSFGKILPIKGIIEDAELINIPQSYTHLLFGTIDNYNYYMNEGGIAINPNFSFKPINYTYDNNSYIPPNKKARIINASLNISLNDEKYVALFDVLFKTWKAFANDGRGVLFVAAAGNSNNNTTQAQKFSQFNEPLIVSASTIDNDKVFGNTKEVKAPYSSYGNRVDMCAPSNGMNHGIYSTTNLKCGEIGYDDEVIKRTITIQSNNGDLTLDNVNQIFPGNCVEIGVPGDFNHEVLIIKDVDRTTNKIIFVKDRYYTSTPFSINPPEVRIPILKTVGTITALNAVTINDDKGFAYRGQEIFIFNGTDNHHATIDIVTNSKEFTFTPALPSNFAISIIEVIPGQTSCMSTSYKIIEDRTELTFLPIYNNQLNSFFVGEMVAVYGKNNGTHSFLAVANIDAINTNGVRTITLDKYKLEPGFTDVELKSVGYGSYTSSFGGTSSATPVVSGVAGLIVRANPDLNSVEIKHILKETADKITGQSNYSQVTNYNRYNYGYSTNDNFGAGRVNAKNAVQLAKDWKTSTTLQKPKLVIADRDVNGILDGVASTDPVDSPDIWLNSETPPLTNQNFNELDTSKTQKIYVRVRNKGNRESFKGCDLRVLVSFTNEEKPAFPFPDKWYQQTDVKLIAVKEIDPIPANSEKIVEIDLKKIADIWNEWNPEINGKRKNAYLMAHIAPFDGDAGELSLTNIRSNKQLTCKPIIVKYNGIKNKISYITGSKLNITVDSGIVDRSYDLIMENILTADLTTFRLKASKKKKNNIVEEVYYKKIAGVWSIEGGIAVDWITFQTPEETPESNPNYTKIKFPHTIKVNNKETEVKLEIVNT